MVLCICKRIIVKTYFLVLAMIGISVADLCYCRGVYLKDRERQETIRGVQREKRAPFAERCRFVPVLNILPLFSYLRRHLNDF